jgi:hypothetical protein
MSPGETPSGSVTEFKVLFVVALIVLGHEVLSIVMKSNIVRNEIIKMK